MSNLNQDLQEQFFSSARLRGYTNIQEHEDNLTLIASIAHKVGILEIILRNKIDFTLSQVNTQWLESLPQEIEIDFSRPCNQDSSKDKVISSQNLGFWIKVIEHYKIHNQLFSVDFLDNLDFKKYFKKNKNTFKAKHNRLMRHHKVRAIILLLRLVRNRAFHFENLYKIAGNGYPRLNVKLTNKYNQNVYIAIQPNKIKDFVDDILASFHKDLVHYAENKK